MTTTDTAIPVDFFAEAQRAMELVDECEEVDSDVEDEWGNNMLQTQYKDATDRLCRLPDGDLHYCDHHCPFAHPDKDGNRVCVHTGLVVGHVTIERSDNSTGRSTWSCDPDMNSGGPVGGAWRKKRDMVKASSTAYDEARSLDDAEMPKAIEVERPLRSSSKRGALCVDEAPPEDSGPKRIRVSKKDVQSHSTRTVLMETAVSTFTKIVGKQSRKSDTKPVVDPRLLKKDLLYTAAVKKYLKEVAANGETPSIDDLSNIELAVGKVVREETAKYNASLLDEGRVYSMHFSAAAARLAVSLWSGACSTPYLRNARRGTDSFRPFCVGVFYAMKRGLSLVDGTVLVPKLDEFTEALPTQRVISADPALKSLHASSHRGLCTLHRSIASVNPQQAVSIFAEAIRSSRAF